MTYACYLVKFAEELLPELLRANGTHPFLCTLDDARNLATYSLKDWDQRREEYYTQVMPQLVSAPEVVAYLFVAEQWVHGPDSTQEHLLFHLQVRNGDSYSRLYRTFRAEDNTVKYYGLWDVDQVPMTGPLTELFP